MDKDKILNIAQRYILKGQTDKAIKELQKLVKASPKDIRSHQKLGDLYLKNGDHEKAIEVYWRVAELYEEEDLNFRSIAMFKKVLSINPKHIDAFHKIAELYQKEGYKGDARNYYQSILKMRPHDQKALNALKIFEEEPPPPKEIPKRGPTIEPVTPKHSPPPEKEMAETKKEIPKRAPTIEPATPKHSPPSETEMAETKMVEETSELSPSPTFNSPNLSYETESVPPDKDSEMHYHLGIAYKEMELFDYAISEFEQAASNPLIRFDSYIMLGNCFLEKGAYDKSIENFKMASEVKGLSKEKLARIQLNLGLAYEASGMNSEALDSYYLALKLDPSSSEAKEKIRRLQQK